MKRTAWFVSDRRFRIPTSFIVLAIACMSSSLGAASARADDEAGFTAIFNGRDLKGWEGEPGAWSVKEGAIVGESTQEKPLKDNTFLIWRDGELDDFELRLKYRIPSGNSGIQYRSEDVGQFRIKGYQADLESGDTWSGIIFEERGRGILCPRGKKVVIDADGKKSETSVADPKELQNHIKKEDWNDYVIIARGNHLIQKINGHVTAEVIDDDPKNGRRTGLLALQLHAGPPMRVEFKDIRLKRLKLADKKKVVMIAGQPSHGFGAHDFHAGVLLLKKRLNAADDILAVSYHNGWPNDPTALDNADAIVLYMDGGGGHPVLKHLEAVRAAMQRGVGLMCMHYAVEVPAGVAGELFRDWIGGYYETGFSVNPHWKAEAQLDSSHPIARGVGPFAVQDEWYFNMRFRDDQSGIANILRARPDDQTRSGASTWPRGPKKHIVDAKGRVETLLWAVERPDGGRGIGFTGGHFHKHWADDDYRKLVLNAIVWVAGADVPTDGIASESVSEQELEANNDEPIPKK